MRLSNLGAFLAWLPDKVRKNWSSSSHSHQGGTQFNYCHIMDQEWIGHSSEEIPRETCYQNKRRKLVHKMIMATVDHLKVKLRLLPNRCPNVSSVCLSVFVLNFVCRETHLIHRIRLCRIIVTSNQQQEPPHLRLHNRAPFLRLVLFPLSSSREKIFGYRLIKLWSLIWIDDCDDED